jgi:hypothetical protein
MFPRTRLVHRAMELIRGAGAYPYWHIPHRWNTVIMMSSVIFWTPLSRSLAGIEAYPICTTQNSTGLPDNSRERGCLFQAGVISTVTRTRK